MRDVCESVVAHSPDHGGTELRDEAEQSHSACVHMEASGRDRTPLLSTRTSERRDAVLVKVQGQLKGVDQEACLQLIYESGQRPKNQITTLGLVSRQKLESGEQVTESFNFPGGFFNCMVLESQTTNSVPRQLRLAIESHIDEICPNRNHQSRLQHENLDVGTTRPLRGVALFDETCDLTDEDAQEATVRACRSVNPGIIIVCIPRTVSRSHLEFCMTLCTWQHERGALYILILTEFRGCTFRGTVFGTQNAAPKRRECLARTGVMTSGDRGKVGLQPSCHEPCSRVDQFIHDGRTQFNKKR